MAAEQSVETNLGRPHLWDIQFVCRFFGGTKPISKATVYRMVKRRILPAPINVYGSSRWIGSECEAARRKMIAERDAAAKVEGTNKASELQGCAQ